MNSLAWVTALCSSVLQLQNSWQRGASANSKVLKCRFRAFSDWRGLESQHTERFLEQVSPGAQELPHFCFRTGKWELKVRPNSLSRNLEGRFQVPGQFYCWPSLWLCCSGAAELFLSVLSANVSVRVPVLSAKFSNRPSETFQDQWLKRYQMTWNETCTWIPSSRNDILGGQLSDFTWLQTFTVSTGTCTLLHYVIVHLCWFGR